VSELKAILKRVSDGEAASKDDRLFALDELLLQRSATNQQLAQVLGVTERQIRRDKAELRERWQTAIRDKHLIGQLYGEWQATLARMDLAIEAADYKKAKALAGRWSVVEGFARIAITAQLDSIAELIEQLQKVQAGRNGHDSGRLQT